MHGGPFTGVIKTSIGLSERPGAYTRALRCDPKYFLRHICIRMWLQAAIREKINELYFLNESKDYSLCYVKFWWNQCCYHHFSILRREPKLGFTLGIINRMPSCPCLKSCEITRTDMTYFCSEPVAGSVARSAKDENEKCMAIAAASEMASMASTP